eukprot:CAMPEP_0177682872 /NCGR_PEP_ID=MMETSP0447-20121125/31481_1 /TAXON_ID=0 /ORGANISM="Stygamoeba regulata, Strain BSH-02190019" /LENGTH=74 /DNA_ID=CAMNT_0019192385 /DNA_START=71 /DNA_END=292 /DNA_ORIENTATION=+
MVLFTPEKELSYREKILKLLPSGTSWLFTIFINALSQFHADCDDLKKILLVVGIAVLAVYALLTPWIHHVHEGW